MKISHWVGVSVLCMSANAASAQDDCRAILQGIYDINDTSISIQTAQAAKNWFCNGDSASASGKYLEVFSGSGSWSKSRCASDAMSSQDLQDIRETIRKANPTIAAAWSSCMNRKGLQTAVILSDDPARFQIYFDYTSVAGSIPEATLRDGENGFTLQGDVTCKGDWLTTKNRTVTTDGMVVACTRKNPAQPIDIIINAEPQPDNSVLTVAAYNPIVAPPVAAKICLERSAVSGSTGKSTSSMSCTTTGFDSDWINFGDDTGWKQQNIRISAQGGRACVNFTRFGSNTVQRCSEGGSFSNNAYIGDDTGWAGQKISLNWTGAGRLCGRFAHNKLNEKAISTSWECSQGGVDSGWIDIGDDNHWYDQRLLITLRDP